MEKAMAIKINNDKCTGCGVCVDICPVQAIKIENQKAIINEECVECAACIDQCPNQAIFQ